MLSLQALMRVNRKGVAPLLRIKLFGSQPPKLFHTILGFYSSKNLNYVDTKLYENG